MTNTSPGNWQNYMSSPQQTYATQQYPIGQQSSVYGQNGGNFGMQQPDPPFVGRYINQIEDVMPREVPMDGRAAIFPTQSLEEIYLKAWDRNGTIKTFRYILDPTQNLNAPVAQEPDMGSRILERLDQLEQRLGETQQAKNANRRNNSKGGDENA